MNAPNFQVVMLAKGKARVEIYDDIGPSWLGMIDTKLVASKLSDDLTEIEVRINSLGGIAHEGLGIYSVLRDHKANVTVVIDGIAASAASIIAMAGDTVRIPTNALLMIHDPMTFAFGTKKDMQKAVNALDAYTTAGIATYAEKSKQPEDKVAKWMRDETWFTGQEAVDAGLADTTEKELPAEKVALASKARELFSKGPLDMSAFHAISMQLKEPPIMADTNPTTPATPAPPPAPPATPPANNPAPPAASSAAQLTAADVKATADKAVADERSRIAAVMAVCQKAGKSDMANEFIANGTSLADVQTRMFEVLCAARPPVGDAGGTDPTQPKDPDVALKKEYADNRAAMQKAGITEEDYVASRKVTEEHQGRVAMIPAPKPAAKA